MKKVLRPLNEHAYSNFKSCNFVCIDETPNVIYRGYFGSVPILIGFYQNHVAVTCSGSGLLASVKVSVDLTDQNLIEEIVDDIDALFYQHIARQIYAELDDVPRLALGIYFGNTSLEKRAVGQFIDKFRKDVDSAVKNELKYQNR